MDLSTLKRRGEALLSGLARSELRSARGDSSADFARTFDAFDDLASRDAAALAREAGGSSLPGDRVAGARLLELVAWAWEGRRTSRSLEERDAFSLKASIRIDGDVVLFRALPGRIANEPRRGARARIASAWAGALPSLDAALARRVEQCQETAHELDVGGYEALCSATSGIDLAPLSGEADSVLAGTEDAWRDLAAFALRRAVGPIALKPRGEAAWHDLERLGRMAPLDDDFRSSRLRPSLELALEAMGLRLDGGGRIDLDLEASQGRRPEPLVARLEVPRSIAVLLQPLGGAADYLAALELAGRAQQLALISERAPMEDRWLGDLSVQRGFGLAFAHFLLEPRFLSRALGVDPSRALEAARLFAVVQLAALRGTCGQLAFERALYAEGPRGDMKAFYREAMHKALFVDWPAERWLWDVEPRFGCARMLRGFALEASLHRAMLETCDEDHWRNPRLGAFLEGHASRGQRLDASALAKELGTPLSLAGAAARLVEVAAR